VERAGKTLWKALRKLAKPDRPLDMLGAVWPLIVGPRLAGHTRPLYWTENRLRVGVDEGPWKSQVERLEKPIRAKINNWWGHGLVREIQFVAQRSRPGPAGKVRTPRSRAKAVKLTGQEVERRFRERLKELKGLEGIRDDELRELIARVATRYLENAKS